MVDCTRELLSRLVEEVKKDMRDAGIPFNDEIKVEIASRRTKKRLGTCYYAYDKHERRYVATRITLSEFAFLRDEQTLRNIICHELIHSANQCTRSGHKGKWKEYANLMNFSNRKYDIQRLTPAFDDADKNKHFKYKVTCNGCGNEFYTLKKTILIRELENGGCKSRICSKCKSKNFSFINLQ